MAINAAVFPYVMFKVINFKDILIINIYPEIEQTQDMMFKCIFIPQLTAYSLHKTKYQCMLTSSMHNAFMVSYIHCMIILNWFVVEVSRDPAPSYRENVSVVTETVWMVLPSSKTTLSMTCL